MNRFLTSFASHIRLCGVLCRSCCSLVGVALMFTANIVVPTAALAQASCDGINAEFVAARAMEGTAKVEALRGIHARCTTFVTSYALAVARIQVGDFDAAIATLKETEKNQLDVKNLGAVAAVYGRFAEAYMGRGELIAAHGSMTLAQATYQQIRKSEREQQGEAKTKNPDWFDKARRAVESQLAEPKNLAVVAQLLKKNVGGDVVSKSFGIRPAIDLRIKFEFAKASLTAEGRELVEKLVEVIHADKGEGKILLIGHTDEQGTARVNDELSKERAKTVLKAVLRGLPNAAARIKSCGKGARSPSFARASSEQDHALNRRVELSFDSKACENNPI